MREALVSYGSGASTFAASAVPGADVINRIISSVAKRLDTYAMRGRNWKKLQAPQQRALVQSILGFGVDPAREEDVPPLLDCVLRHSQSQFREDLLLLPTLLEVTGGLPGTFVELGALDGIDASNSERTCLPCAT